MKNKQLTKGFPDASDGKDCLQSRTPRFYTQLGNFPGEENGNSLQYSCLENSMDRGAWQLYSPWGCKESDTTNQLTQGSAPSSRVCLHVNQYMCTCLCFCVHVSLWGVCVCVCAFIRELRLGRLVSI